jgi:hypothetical protein
MLPLLKIGHRELPIARGTLHAHLEALLLLFLADVQEEFQDAVPLSLIIRSKSLICR